MIAVFLILSFKMVAESAVVIASSLYISCSFFELKQNAGFILFHVIREYVDSNPVELSLHVALMLQTEANI